MTGDLRQLGSVVLVGVSGGGQPKFIDGAYLVQGLDADGLPHPILVGDDGALSGSGSTQYALLQDRKTQNTDGGTFTTGAQRTRDLNTEVVDTDGIVSLASNQFTLGAGTYRLRAYAPAHAVASHQARLQNITDASTTLLGTTAHSTTGSGGNIPSIIEGEFTITDTKVFEIQHICGSTKTTDGFGAKGNFAQEIYTSVTIEKVA